MRDILGYTFATIAGVCFAGGIAVLSGGKGEVNGLSRQSADHPRLYSQLKTQAPYCWRNPYQYVNPICRVGCYCDEHQGGR